MAVHTGKTMADCGTHMEQWMEISWLSFGKTVQETSEEVYFMVLDEQKLLEIKCRKYFHIFFTFYRYHSNDIVTVQ